MALLHLVDDNELAPKTECGLVLYGERPFPAVCGPEGPTCKECLTKEEEINNQFQTRMELFHQQVRDGIDPAESLAMVEGLTPSELLDLEED